MRFSWDKNNKPIEQSVTSLSNHEHSTQAVNGLYTRILLLLQIGRDEDELLLFPDGIIDLGWAIVRPGQDKPVMCGLLHFCDRDGTWSSHT